ncbi:MAG: hypothetical protein GY751_21450 [Bacteroidetes bacterium]|nr:hypothetical protein [Bacteroidota bacterium]
MPTQKRPKPFHPEDFRFKKLDLQHGNLCFYEFTSGDFCDGKLNPHRINVYLSKDNDFVTVWHGLFDPVFIDQRFHDLVKQAGLDDFDFYTQYHTSLLRAHIQNSDEAGVILNSLRYERYIPNMLTIDEENRIACISIKQPVIS